MSKDQEDSWLVEVFRYSSGKGWELYQQDSSQKITAAPRRGSVEVRQLRLRIHILQPSNPSDSNKQASASADNLTNYEHTTSVVRRRDTVLLSKGNFGAVVLKFQSVAASIAFTDRLTELNQDCNLKQNEDKPLQRQTAGVGNKRIVGAEGNTNDSNDEQAQERNFAIQSHIITLLHDEEFLGFVDRIENCLSSNDDCMQMLQALEYPRAKRQRPA